MEKEEIYFFLLSIHSEKDKTIEGFLEENPPFVKDDKELYEKINFLFDKNYVKKKIKNLSLTDLGKQKFYSLGKEISKKKYIELIRYVPNKKNDYKIKMIETSSISFFIGLIFFFLYTTFPNFNKIVLIGFLTIFYICFIIAFTSLTRMVFENFLKKIYNLSRDISFYSFKYSKIIVWSFIIILNLVGLILYVLLSDSHIRAQIGDFILAFEGSLIFYILTNIKPINSFFEKILNKKKKLNF